MANVIIYTTPTCVYCKMAKDFFQEHGIAYNEKNVMMEVDSREEMIQKSGQMGVPVIDVDGDILVGFNKAKLSELLGIA